MPMNGPAFLGICILSFLEILQVRLPAPACMSDLNSKENQHNNVDYISICVVISVVPIRGTLRTLILKFSRIILAFWMCK